MKIAFCTIFTLLTLASKSFKFSTATAPPAYVPGPVKLRNIKGPLPVNAFNFSVIGESKIQTKIKSSNTGSNEVPKDKYSLKFTNDTSARPKVKTINNLPLSLSEINEDGRIQKNDEELNPERSNQNIEDLPNSTTISENIQQKEGQQPQTTKLQDQLNQTNVERTDTSSEEVIIAEAYTKMLDWVVALTSQESSISSKQTTQP